MTIGTPQAGKLAQPARRRRGLLGRHASPGEAVVLALASAPAILLVGAVILVPLAGAVYLSFHDVRLGPVMVPRPIGLENYLMLWRNPGLARSLLATAVFSGASVALITVAGFLAALVLARKFPGNRALFGLAIVPWAMPWIANALLWKWIFDPSNGALNGLVASLGLIRVSDYIAWLATPEGAMAGVVVAYAWKLTPFAMVLFYAALQEVPQEVLEAAAVDGASAAAVLWHIILPLLRPILFIVVVFTTVWSLRDFDTIFTLTQGGPGGATTILNWYTYAASFRYGNIGEGAAVGVVLAAIALILFVAYVRILYAEVKY